MSQKLAKKLPKRVGNEKKKSLRSRSWEKNRKAKEMRIAEQLQREKHNRKMGCTGKMRYSNNTHSADCAVINNQRIHIPA